MATQYPLNHEAFIWALSAFCQLNCIPFSPDLLVKQYPPPYTNIQLEHALQSFGFNTSLKQSRLSKLNATSLPCLAILKPNLQQSSSLASDSATEQQAESPVEYPIALILSLDNERVLLLEFGQAQPQTLAIKELESRLTGDFLMVRKAEQKVHEDHGALGSNKAGSNTANQINSQKEFSFRWFIPELLKYKKIWSEVLTASLAIQLVSLAVPICTQIVIDKVVVHHTTSTLIVIGIALFIFLTFTGVMGWVRQYLVLHTGNRIDATLGHKVFSHLLDLPVRYYDHRPTGVIIARVHGVETIREFLAGGLITLLLDFPFLIVFLAIMFWYSWQLTLISVACLALISILSFIVTPIFRAKLNHQFMLGARNQAFLTEYVSGMETVKSLQMEPQLKQTFGNYLSTYLNASFDSRKLSITYNTAANTLDQLQTLAILCVGAWQVITIFKA